MLYESFYVERIEEMGKNSRKKYFYKCFYIILIFTLIFTLMFSANGITVLADEVTSVDSDSSDDYGSAYDTAIQTTAKHKVSLSTNMGYWGNTGEYSEELRTMYVGDNEKLGQLPSVWRTYCEFTGWNTKYDGTGTTVTEDTIISELTQTDITLYAQWKQAYISSTVTFDANGGTCDTKSITVLTNSMFGGMQYTESFEDKIINSIPEASKTGLRFVGWFDEDGNKLEEKTQITHDVTYTARYVDLTDNTCVVAFVAKYNQGPITYVVEKNTRLGKVPSAPSRDGYTFKGWYTSYVDSTATRIDANTVINSDMTVYAQWTPNSKIKESVVQNENYSRQITESDYKALIDADYVRDMYEAYLDEHDVYYIPSDEDGYYQPNTDEAIIDYFYKNMMFNGFRPSSWFDPDYYYDYVRARYNTKLGSYKDIYNFYIGGNLFAPTNSYCMHQTNTSYDDSYVAIEHSETYDDYTEKFIDTKINCSCGVLFDNIDEWTWHNMDAINGNKHSWGPANIYEKVFASEEDHAHVDKNVVIYCGSSGEQVSTQNITRVYLEAETKMADKFWDVKRGSWYFDNVSKIVDMGIMSGYSSISFGPNDQVKRAQFAVILCNWQGKKHVDAENKFSDVVSGSWYYDCVTWASSMKYINGYSNGKFGVNDPLTREQMAVIFKNYAAKNGYDVSERADLSGYSDGNDVSNYAKESVQWAVSKGLLGQSSKLRAKSTCTRAEAATILLRFMDKLNS